MSRAIGLVSRGFRKLAEQVPASFYWRGYQIDCIAQAPSVDRDLEEGGFMRDERVTLLVDYGVWSSRDSTIHTVDDTIHTIDGDYEDWKILSSWHQDSPGSDLYWRSREDKTPVEITITDDQRRLTIDQDYIGFDGIFLGYYGRPVDITIDMEELPSRHFRSKPVAGMTLEFRGKTYVIRTARPMEWGQYLAKLECQYIRKMDPQRI